MIGFVLVVVVLWDICGIVIRRKTRGINVFTERSHTAKGSVLILYLPFQLSLLHTGLYRGETSDV